jgi:hypothetical protein
MTVGARPAGALLTPVTYFHAAIDAPIHERIKEVSATEATAGPDQVAIRCAEVAASMRTRLAEESSDRLVAALGGRMLHGDWAVLHALARNERRTVDVFPAF